jgi:hypothetical protein
MSNGKWNDTDVMTPTSVPIYGTSLPASAGAARASRVRALNTKPNFKWLDFELMSFIIFSLFVSLYCGSFPVAEGPFNPQCENGDKEGPAKD